jgi:hypothetical protein
MELFRYSRNVYGQTTLEGVSFELVWVFIGAAALFIVGHLLFKLLSAGKARKPGA